MKQLSLLLSAGFGVFLTLGLFSFLKWFFPEQDGVQMFIAGLVAVGLCVFFAVFMKRVSHVSWPDIALIFAILLATSIFVALLISGLQLGFWLAIPVRIVGVLATLWLMNWLVPASKKFK